MHDLAVPKEIVLVLEDSQRHITCPQNIVVEDYHVPIFLHTTIDSRVDLESYLKKKRLSR